MCGSFMYGTSSQDTMSQLMLKCIVKHGRCINAVSKSFTFCIIFTHVDFLLSLLLNKLTKLNTGLVVGIRIPWTSLIRTLNVYNGTNTDRDILTTLHLL